MNGKGEISELNTSAVTYLDPSGSVHFLWSVVLDLVDNQAWDCSPGLVLSSRSW